MKNIFRLDADKSGSVSFRELVTFSINFRQTSSSKDIVLKWVFKSCIELVKCQKDQKEKWLQMSFKFFATMPGNFWVSQFQTELPDKFSTMLIKTEMDWSPMLNISNSSKSTSVKLKLNSKVELNLKLRHQNQLTLDQKDSQDLENGFGNNFSDFTTLTSITEIYL